MAKKQIKKQVIKPMPQSKGSPQKPVEKNVEKPLDKKGFALNVKLALLLGLISFLVYANSIKNGFVLDDSSAITENTIVSKGISAIPEILSTPYRRGYIVTANDLYRPLSLVTFAIEYQFVGKNPASYHFFNVVLFAGCVMLLFFFLDSFFGQKKIAIAFIASLLFALHPIHTEVVANIKSRDELLCFFFAFFSLNILLKYMQNGKIKDLLLGSFCFLLSIFSKETVITFLAIIPLIFFFYKNEDKKRGVFIVISAGCVAVFYLVVRFSVLSYYHANSVAAIALIDNALVGAPNIEARLATAVLILGYYLKLLIVPYPLICDYGFNSIPFVHFSDLGVLISLAVYLSLAVVGIKRFINNNRDPYAFGILFYLITMSLFSNILFLIGATMGERFLFFGSVGFCIIVALLIEKAAGKTVEAGAAFFKNKIVLAIVIPVGLIYAILTFNRNNDWTDRYSLYKADILKAPNSGKLNYFYGLILEKDIADEEKDPVKKKQIMQEGVTYMRKSVTIDPTFSDGYSNLGNAYFNQLKFDSAEIYEKKAVDLFPYNINAINNLTNVYYINKKYIQSIELSRHAIQLNPDNAKQYFNIELCYIRLGRYDSAAFYQNKANLINPEQIKSDAPMVQAQIGDAYFENKIYDSAEVHYLSSLHLNPNNSSAIVNLAIIYMNEKKYDQGIQLFRKAFQLNPNDVNAICNLALSNKLLGNMDSARKYEQLAKKYVPGFSL